MSRLIRFGNLGFFITKQKGSIFVLTVALETLYADLHWCTSEYRNLYVPMVLTIRLIQVWADANVNVYIKRKDYKLSLLLHVLHNVGNVHLMSCY